MFLKDFWNSVECKSLFIVSTAIPMGEEFTGWDMWDVIDHGLSPVDLWGVSGNVDVHGNWHWDGKGSIRDYKGNDYLKISLIAAN